MRITRSVTTVSWIPSEAVSGLMRASFDVGFSHYDAPPPDTLGDLRSWCTDDRFRFANDLTAWVDVVDGEVRDAGYAGGVLMGSTTVRVGRLGATFAAYAMPTLQRPVEVDGGAARFVQTVGGRTALPAPRRVSRPPYVRLTAPLVWTTLALTVHADGRAEHELLGASPFPRHWVYDVDGQLAEKAGLADYDHWYRHSFGRHTPWGDEDSRPVVTAAESALERQLSALLMSGRPEVRELAAGATLTRQGEPGDELYVLLDGVLEVEVDGVDVAEVGPGAVLGERAVLENGRRTSTLRAGTPVRVAVAPAERVDRRALAEVTERHRRELHRATG